MKLITARCPDCGADLNIPEGSGSVKCEYCGSNVTVSDVLGSTDVVRNCMILAYDALKIENYKDAYDHFNRAIENDMKNYSAWMGKAICTGQLNKIANPRFDEITAMFENALNYAPADKQENLKKNIAAETPKVVRHLVKNEELLLDLYDLAADSDVSATAEDIRNNFKKSREGATQILQKAHEYDPANEEVNTLLNEFLAGKHLNPGPTKKPAEKMTPPESAYFKDLSKNQNVQAPPPEILFPKSTPVQNTKKSGCFGVVIVLALIAGTGLLIFL